MINRHVRKCSCAYFSGNAVISLGTSVKLLNFYFLNVYLFRANQVVFNTNFQVCFDIQKTYTIFY